MPVGGLDLAERPDEVQLRKWRPEDEWAPHDLPQRVGHMVQSLQRDLRVLREQHDDLL
jgi:hypothetical protein